MISHRAVLLALIVVTFACAVGVFVWWGKSGASTRNVTPDVVAHAQPPSHTPTGLAVPASDTAADPTRTTKPRRPDIQGIVRLRKTSEPVMGFTLLAEGPREKHETTTDQAGHYAFNGLTDGKAYRIRPVEHLTGLIPADYSEITVHSGRTAEYDLWLSEGASIAGRVIVQPFGRGVAGAQLWARCGYLEASAETDKGGYYLIQGLPPGGYAISCVGLPGFLVESGSSQAPKLTRGVELAADETMDRVDFEFRQGLSISGRVVDTQGQPVAGATLDALIASQTVLNDDTDRNGAFCIHGARPNKSYEFKLQAPLHATMCYTIDVLNEDRRAVELVMPHAVTVQGTLADPSGRPYDKGSVSLIPFPYPSEEEGWEVVLTPSVQADANGDFIVPKVAPGDYYPRLVISRAENGGALELRKQIIHVPNGGLRHLRITGPEIVEWISGEVVDGSGQPIPDVRVSGRLDGTRTGTATDENGLFSLIGLALAGDLVVDFTHPSHGELSLTPAMGSKGIKVVMGANVGVAGAVYAARTGAPVAGARVDAWRITAASSGPRRFSYHVETDGDGRFHLEDVPSQLEKLHVTAPGFMPTEMGVEVAPGGMAEVHIPLEPSGVLHVYLETPDTGENIEAGSGNRFVYVESPTGPAPVHPRIPDDYPYRQVQLPPGAYRVIGELQGIDGSVFRGETRAEVRAGEVSEIRIPVEYKP